MKCLKDEKAHKAQHAHKYCLEGDPVTKATDCFESVFAKVDTFLANQLCFEKGKDLLPIPVRDTDLYKYREGLLKDFMWMQKLREVFVEQYTVNI